MILSYAYLLVFHGSRDYRTQTAAANLKDLLTAKYQSKNILTQHNYLEKNSRDIAAKSGFKSTLVARNKTPLIDIAALELADRSLSDRLVDFGRQARLQGIERIKVIPLFLAPGVHVCADIPTEINSAIAQLDSQITIELSPFLGKYSGMETLLGQKFARLSAQTRILIAHGSRLPGVAEYYQTLGKRLGADVAYWSTAPKFADRVKAQIDSGSQKIALLPYFLFPGKITRAISTKIAELQQQYPQVELNLGQPLGATSAIAELIVQEV